MSDINFVLIFFKFANFAILGLFLAYLTKKYIAPALKESLYAFVSVYYNLQNQYNISLKKVEQLEKDLVVQAALIEDLQSKVQQWQEVDKQHQLACKRHYENAIVSLNKKRLIQSEYLSESKVKTELFNEIFNEVETTLKNEAPDLQKDYIKRIDAFMTHELQS